MTNAEIVERIWGRDAALWTGADEAKWLGWLDEPWRMREDVDLLLSFAESVAGDVDDVVLLGMGGSSLAPEVIRLHVRARPVPRPRHDASAGDPRPRGEDRRRAHAVRLGVEVGLDARDALAHGLLPREGRCVGGDHGPGLRARGARGEAKLRATFSGEPTIGGRYSALSAFGMVPAALMGVDVARLLDRAQEMADGCRHAEGNPGLELGLSLGENWRDGRDKVCIDAGASSFGLWAEQLLAESTGKLGKGLVPAPGEPPDGPDRQAQEVRLANEYELGQEFFRWEFATAVAGLDPRHQPVRPARRAARRRTRRRQSSPPGTEPDVSPQGSPDELFAQAQPGDYVCDPRVRQPDRCERGEVLALAAREQREATGCVVTHGFGPRYLHSTGQLHKGGPPTGLFLQVVDDTGDEIAIPNQPFGFGKLIRAQAAGDFASLQERGRRVARVRLEEV